MEMYDRQELIADLMCLTTCVFFAVLQQLVDYRFRYAHQGRRETLERLLLRIAFQRPFFLARNHNVRQLMTSTPRSESQFDRIVFCDDGITRSRTDDGSDSG